MRIEFALLIGLIFLAGCGGECIDKFATCEIGEKCCDGFVCQPVGDENMCLPLAGKQVAPIIPSQPTTPPAELRCGWDGDPCVNHWDCCWSENLDENGKGMWCDSGRCSGDCVPNGKKINMQTAAFCCSGYYNSDLICESGD